MLSHTDTRVDMLGREHVPAVYALELTCFTLPWSREQLEAAFAQPHYLAMGVGEAGLLGYISCFFVTQELEILNIGVLPQHRRNGLGRRLLTTTLQAAQKMDMQRAVLEVREHNIPAINLYKSVGFVPTGKRPKYYTDTGEDAIIYTFIPS